MPFAVVTLLLPATGWEDVGSMARMSDLYPITVVHPVSKVYRKAQECSSALSAGLCNSAAIRITRFARAKPSFKFVVWYHPGHRNQRRASKRKQTARGASFVNLHFNLSKSEIGSEARYTGGESLTRISFLPPTASYTRERYACSSWLRGCLVRNLKA